MTGNQDLLNPNSQTPSLIDFPSVFPIKVMGEASTFFTDEMLQLIQQHAPQFNAENIEKRASSAGKYTSLTCFVLVDSQAQLDAIYRAMTAHPLVKFAL